ncbi:MAG: phosphoribosylanthranilate isomerase, partial [Pseudomonadota bacterium]
ARDDGRTQIVALTVQADLELLAAIAGRVQPDIIQLHGDESAADMARVRANVPGVTVWRACPVATATDVQAAEAYWQPGRLADRLLFDARADTTSTLPGGNGLTFDWTILSGVNPRGNFALAGGLTPDNVALAVSKTGADIVDVSSGVETAPGMKSAKLMADFVNAAKSVQPLQSSEVGA